MAAQLCFAGDLRELLEGIIDYHTGSAVTYKNK
jgi:hypothetical protein